MANNYIQFSEILEGLNGEEAKWIEALAGLGNKFDAEEHFNADGTGKTELGKIAKELWGEEDTYISCKAQDEGDDVWAVWFYSEEGNDPYPVGQVVQQFIKKFRPGSGLVWGFQWAEYCDKLRIDEFGGGALVVSEGRIISENTFAMLERLKKELASD